MHRYVSAARVSPQMRNFILLLALTIAAFPGARAQTFSIIFNLPVSANMPWGALTLDAAGNLYGTTMLSNNQNGTAFQLKNSHGTYLFTPLITFTEPGGSVPYAGMTFGPGGALYGTTGNGGTYDAGTVYALRPPRTLCRTINCPWSRTVVHSFGGSGDGAVPYLGSLVFDASGNMYGTTSGGGAFAMGTVFELSRNGDGTWTEQVLYSFTGGADGFGPGSSVAFDAAGNIYGTAGGGNTSCGTSGCGVVYKLTHSGSGWAGSVIYRFSGAADGEYPLGGVIFDQAGNMYGGTLQGGPNLGGTIYELSPNGVGWSFTLVYAIPEGLYGPGGPIGNLVLDSTGALLGTTFQDGALGSGNIFKLTRQNGIWTYTDLHDFDAFDTQNGSEPVGTPILDASGNLYGTTSGGGTQDCGFEIQCGTVWKLTPQ